MRLHHWLYMTIQEYSYVAVWLLLWSMYTLIFLMVMHVPIDIHTVPSTFDIKNSAP